MRVSRILAVFISLIIIISVVSVGIYIRRNADDIDTDFDEEDGDHGTGLLAGDYDYAESEDYELSALPDSVNLMSDKYFPPIGDQGSQGSCSAWAVGYYANTYSQMSERGLDASKSENQMSPAWVYNMINGGTDDGGSFEDAMNLLDTVGNADMRNMTYDVDDYKSWGNEDAWDTSYRYRTDGFVSYDYSENDSIKGLLSDGKVPFFALDSGQYDYAEYDSDLGNQIISDSNLVTSDTPDHANVLVGYDDNISYDGEDGAFLAANSWGDDWFDDGTYWITYDAFANLLDDSGPIVDYNTHAINDIRYKDGSYPELTMDIHLDDVGSRDAGFEIYTSDGTMDYKWVSDQDNHLPDYLSFDFTDLGYNEEVQLNITDSDDILDVGNVELNYHLSDYTKVNDTYLDVDNSNGLEETFDFVLMSDILDVEPDTLDVPDGEIEVIFDYSMNTSVEPNFDGIEGLSFDRWDNTEYVNDTAVFVYNDMNESQDFNVDIYNFKSVEGWDDNSDSFGLESEVRLPNIDDLTEGTPETGEFFDIEFNVTDYSSVDDVFIEYWTDKTGKVNVSSDEVSTEVYEGATVFYYRCNAVDIYGNWNSTSISSVDVDDVILPELLEDNTTQRISDDHVIFEAFVEDNIGVDSVRVVYRYLNDNLQEDSNMIDIKRSDGVYSEMVALDYKGHDLEYRFYIEDINGNVNTTDWRVIDSVWDETIGYIDFVDVAGLSLDHEDKYEDATVDYEEDIFETFFGGRREYVTIDYHESLSNTSVSFDINSDDLGLFGDYLIVYEVDNETYMLNKEMADGVVKRSNSDSIELLIGDVSLDSIEIYKNPSVLDYFSEWISSFDVNLFIVSCVDDKSSPSEAKAIVDRRPYIVGV